MCITAGCMQPTAGTRCQRCEREHQAQRNADPKRKAYRDPAYRAIPLGGQVCWCCGTDQDLTRHHVTPLALERSIRPDGTPAFFAPDAVAPVVPMCRSCNSSIGWHTMEDHRCPQHGGVVLDG